MKKVVSLLLAMQIFLITAPAMGNELSSDNNLNEDTPIKICCQDNNGNEIPGYHVSPGSSYSNSSNAGWIAGIAAGGVGTLALLGTALKDYNDNNLFKFSAVQQLPTAANLSSDELSGYITRNYSDNSLAPIAFIASENLRNEQDNIKPVVLSNVISDSSECEKVIILGDADIQSSVLQLYSFKLPYDENNLKNKVSIRATLVSTRPDPDNVIDYYLVKNGDAKRIARHITKKHDKYREKLENLKINSDMAEQKGLNVVQKEFTVNNNSDKPVIFAVSCLSKDRNAEISKNYNYAVILRIKPTK